MNSDIAPNAQPVRRRVRYIDAPLQRWLWLVVVLEVVAAAACVGLLYWRLNGMIEASLYRVHLGSAASIVPALMHDGFMLLLLFIAGNIVALLLATLIWARYVHGIISEFTSLVEKTHQLDFGADSSAPARHEVLSLAIQWRAMERERLEAIRQAVAILSAAQSSASDRTDALKRLQRILP
jgi:hypothetical protein